MRAYSQGKDKKISNIISIDNDFLIGSLRQKICSRKSHTSQAKKKENKADTEKRRQEGSSKGSAQSLSFNLHNNNPFFVISFTLEGFCVIIVI